MSEDIGACIPLWRWFVWEERQWFVWEERQWCVGEERQWCVGEGITGVLYSPAIPYISLQFLPHISLPVCPMQTQCRPPIQITASIHVLSYAAVCYLGCLV